MQRRNIVWTVGALLLFGGAPGAQSGTIRGQANCGEHCDSVMIYVPVGGGGSAEEAPTLDQIDRTYVPRVLGMGAETPLRLRNGDPELHNVHVYIEGETVFNLAMPFQGMTVDKQLDGPGTYEVRCDVHPEMLAFVVVGKGGRFVHPDAAGEFVIEDVPAGTVAVIRLEPEAGERIEQMVEVGGEGETIEVSF